MKNSLLRPCDAATLDDMYGTVGTPTAHSRRISARADYCECSTASGTTTLSEPQPSSRCAATTIRRMLTATLVTVAVCGITACASSTDSSSRGSTATATAPTTQTSTIAHDAAQRAAAATAAQAGQYGKAIGLAHAINATDLVRRYRQAAARVLERRARHALRTAQYSTAITIARTARRLYGTAPRAAPAIRLQAERQLTARRAVVRLKRQQRAQAAATAEMRRGAAEKTSPSDGGPAGGAGEFAGMTCPEIGHSFMVTPGSDPDHDADNDGVACESQ